MRRSLPTGLALVAMAACGSGKPLVPDAAPDGAVDAAVDAAADAALCPLTLLTGGTDIGAQGWTIVMQPPATLTNGPDYVQLQTTTSGSTSGELLLSYPGAVDAGKPFTLQVVMQVEAVTAHNPLDSAAAILGSFTPATGTTGERSEMIYLDAGKIGWADDSPSFPAFPFTVTDGAYHTYELSVDGAAAATVRVDGTPALTRSGYTTNGTIAVGDQTNDKGLDSTLRIRSVTRLYQ